MSPLFPSLRRLFTRSLAALVAGLLAGCTGDPGGGPGPDGPPIPGAERKPNVLIFLTDDQRVDTLQVMKKTLEWFKDGGTQYTNAFATTPVCCPSRASILSGQYAHNHGVRTNDKALEFSEEDSLARHLDDQGYLTGFAGKYLNLWPEDRPPAHFDRWALIPDLDYSKVYYDFRVNLDGQIQDMPGEYSTDFLAETGVDFLQDFEKSGDDNPWFLYLAPYPPHQPATPEFDYVDSKVTYYPGNPSVREEDRTDKPPLVQADNAGGLMQARAARAKQLRSLRSADDMVDKVMSAVKRLDEDRDTIAFFMSDNGYMWGEHHLNSKRWQYLPSIRIPMLARWPGEIDSGVEDDRIVANIDVAATVLDALGVWPNDVYDTDGRSLLDPAARDRLLLENWFYAKGASTWAATITPDYHYIESYDDAGETLEFQEYYDMKKDPWQLSNLLGDKKKSNDPDADALSEQLAADRTCAIGACP
ncbi:MAG: sulfatase [Actinomycetota bacterium]|nr:sulfatase [Actinomycetota bacterium]